MQIAVFGANYIGLPLAVLLAQNNNVTIVDSSIEKITKINRKENPLKEREITTYLTSDKCNLNASLIKEADYKNIDYAIIAIETFYDPTYDSFNVSEIEKISKKILNANENCLIAIMSSVPVGYTASLKRKLETDRIICVPEFITEGQSIKQYQYLTKLIIGASQTNNRQLDYIEKTTELFLSICHNKKVSLLNCTTSEAEAIKLFTNTYEAMRTSFFNLVQIHSNVKKINYEKILEGICMDPIIGEGDPNPIKHGAYFIPFTIKTLNSDNYEFIDPVTSILGNNAQRKKVIENKTEESDPCVIGIYKLLLKEKYKKSLLNFISQFSARGIKVVVYDPNISDKIYRGCQVYKSFENFKNECNVILAEKISEELKCVQEKVQIV